MRPRMMTRSFELEVWRIVDADTPHFYPLQERLRFDFTVSGMAMSAAGHMASLGTLSDVASSYLANRYTGKLLIAEKDAAARERAVTSAWRLPVALFAHDVDSRTLARCELLGELGRKLAGHGLVLVAVAAKKMGYDLHRASIDESVVQRIAKRVHKGEFASEAMILAGLREETCDEFGRIVAWLAEPRPRTASAASRVNSGKKPPTHGASRRDGATAAP